MGSDADALQDAGFDTFARTGDVYCLFYEQAHKILKDGGNLIFITGSAWLRSNYGKALRRFFIQKTNPIQLIDLSDCQIFQSATVLTTVFQYKKERNLNRLRAIRLTRKTQKYVSQLSTYFSQYASLLNNPTENTWTINDKEKADIKSEVMLQGKPLKMWDIEINYGLKTGLNEAFVIDDSKRNELIKKDKKSIEIIKPLLRGRDLRRFTFTRSGLWLIYIPWHFPLHEDQSIIGPSKEAEAAFKKTYPAIFNHLQEFKEQLENRNQAEVGIRYEWYALQRFGSNYWRNFETPKIVYPNMVKDVSFTYDDVGYYTNQKCFILTGGKLKYLLGVLNSKLFRYCFEEDFPELQGNSREINKVVFEEIPIKVPDEKQEALVNTLVDYLLYLYNPENEALLKHTPNNRIASTIEDVLNMVVYELYFQPYMKTTGLSVMKDLWPHPLSEAKNKAETILEFYKWLQHPENKVRNKILAIDIKSPDLLSRIHSLYSNTSEVSPAYESD